MNIRTPTLDDLETARRTFEDREPRDLFYRAATELVDLALRGATSLTLAEALAVLLQTWNRPFYRYRPFDRQHFLDIEEIVNRQHEILVSLRVRSIGTLSDADRRIVTTVFTTFEEVLGPVGAAKTLHLLAPHFFPLWDRRIAEVYGLRLQGRGMNGENYFRFMTIIGEQSRTLGGEAAIGRNPLKALDEYNYCKYSREWI
jgi:hypothetical protein